VAKRHRPESRRQFTTGFRREIFQVKAADHRMDGVGPRHRPSRSQDVEQTAMAAAAYHHQAANRFQDQCLLVAKVVGFPAAVRLPALQFAGDGEAKTIRDRTGGPDKRKELARLVASDRDNSGCIQEVGRPGNADIPRRLARGECPARFHRRRMQGDPWAGTARQKCGDAAGMVPVAVAQDQQLGPFERNGQLPGVFEKKLI
jgi:hypothetical protein